VFSVLTGMRPLMMLEVMVVNTSLSCVSATPGAPTCWDVEEFFDGDSDELCGPFPLAFNECADLEMLATCADMAADMAAPSSCCEPTSVVKNLQQAQVLCPMFRLLGANAWAAAMNDGDDDEDCGPDMEALCSLDVLTWVNGATSLV
jgi:hypothetical protein